MRLAHVSDLHLLSLEGARLSHFMNKKLAGGVNLALNRGRHYRAEVFAALVEDVNAQGIDEVVCTGDVTNLSFEAEFRFARSFFDRFARGAEHVTCIPGNHDTYVADDIGTFERIFAPYCRADAAFAEGEGVAQWPIVRVRGDVALIGLSTSRPSSWFTSHGELGDAQLARLDKLLADPRLVGCFRVIAIHHPPAGPYAAKVRRGLRDREALAAIVARRGVDLILHGHEHKDLTSMLTGPSGSPVPVRGIQSATYDAPVPERRARYRVYEIVRRSGKVELVGEQLRAWTGAGFAADVAQAA